MKQLHPLPIEEYADLFAPHKKQIELEFRHYLDWNTLYRYLLISCSPYPDFSAQVDVRFFQWSPNEQLFDKGTQVRNYVYQNTFIAECTIYFFDRQHSQSTSIEHTFNLECEYIFDTHPGSTATIELLDAQRKLLSSINESIFDFYRRSGIDGEDFTLGDDNLRDRFQRALYNCQSVARVGVNPLDKWFELIYCLQRVRFTIANTALYKPYLDNPAWHGHFFIDRMVYPSYSTLYDERYFIYCEFTYQSFYHFWDRIGDILAEFVPTGLKETAIDFSRVLDRIKLDQHLSQNLAFVWFDAFKTE